MSIGLYRPTWAEVNLGAIKSNFFELQRQVGSSTAVMPIVKANAYGHGSIQIAKTLEEIGAKYLAVASLEEALELREAGITAPVLIFGYVPTSAAELIVKHNFTITVIEQAMIKELHTAALKNNSQAKVHLKIDTGMGRLGLLDFTEFKEVIELLDSYQGVVLEAIYSHLACSDEVDKAYSIAQYERFKAYIDYVGKRTNKPSVHLANSGAIIDLPKYAHDYVRAGISLYGYYPSAEVNKERVKLLPAMEFKTKVVYLKEVAANTCIGYGATYKTDKQSLIATLPVGYADGYNRLLSNSGKVIVRGMKVPVVGRVCMDQIMIDVTGVPNIQRGDEVVLFGKQSNQQVTVDDIAKQLNTINYEVVCAISSRVPRIYI
ncbi:alanine racemase [Desulfuribacillus alkaliarsenatis]|uniref:Alanine racemase n=1 Tax=Desulfuribacillus alkaliarsenatis TaxID=766136 RepID=A0A1E5G071_9FIRM|nr:alanine racemase [Desulfuribacillus alkaliarsenatis]OEF95877.1 alanine racemase [Desulfuribacillus alkaliarsenatis]